MLKSFLFLSLFGIVCLSTNALASDWSDWITVYSEGQPPNEVRVQISFKLSSCNDEYLKGYSFYRTNNEFKRKGSLSFKFKYKYCDGKLGNGRVLINVEKTGIDQDGGMWFLGSSMDGIYDIETHFYSEKLTNEEGTKQNGVNEIEYKSKENTDYSKKSTKNDNSFKTSTKNENSEKYNENDNYNNSVQKYYDFVEKQQENIKKNQEVYDKLTDDFKNLVKDIFAPQNEEKKPRKKLRYENNPFDDQEYKNESNEKEKYNNEIESDPTGLAKGVGNIYNKRKEKDPIIGSYKELSDYYKKQSSHTETPFDAVIGLISDNITDKATEKVIETVVDPINDNPEIRKFVFNKIRGPLKDKIDNMWRKIVDSKTIDDLITLYVDVTEAKNDFKSAIGRALEFYLSSLFKDASELDENANNQQNNSKP